MDDRVTFSGIDVDASWLLWTCGAYLGLGEDDCVLQVGSVRFLKNLFSPRTSNDFSMDRNAGFHL